MVGFKSGDAMSSETSERVSKFASELDGIASIFTGPINYQDGTVMSEDGTTPSLYDIWYTSQLLEGMTGDSGGN